MTDLFIPCGKRHFAGFEQDVDARARGDLTEEQTRERARRIDPLGQSSYRICAVSPKERMIALDDKLYALMETDADAAHRCTFIEWRRMMLALCREEDRAVCTGGAYAFWRSAGARRRGQAVCCHRAERLAGSARADGRVPLRSSVCRAGGETVPEKAELAAHELGLYAYLFPMSENPFVCDRCRRGASRHPRI